MSNIRLADILKNKKGGEEWYTLMAPEELHKWLFKKPWDSDCFSRRGVHLLGASVSAADEPKSDRTKLTKKTPWHLPNGITVDSGYTQSSTKVTAGFKFRADSSIEFSEIMTAFSVRTDLDIWNINTLEISNNNLRDVVEFKVFNPDGNGASLYLHRVISDGNSRLYPDVLLSRQLEVVGDFYDKKAHCTCTEITEKIHGCAIEHGIKSKQIKLRKNKSSYGFQKQPDLTPQE